MLNELCTELNYFGDKIIIIIICFWYLRDERSFRSIILFIPKKITHLFFNMRDKNPINLILLLCKTTIYFLRFFSYGSIESRSKSDNTDFFILLEFCETKETFMQERTHAHNDMFIITMGLTLGTSISYWNSNIK